MINANASTHPNSSIAEDACIEAGAVIGSGVQIGRRVRVESGAVILGPSIISDDCLVSAGCTLDPSADGDTGSLRLEPGVRLMPGVTIAAKVRISAGARIQAGAVVTRAVPPHSIVEGNPAQIVGYTLSRPDNSSSTQAQPPEQPGASSSSVADVTFHRMPKILDLRGNLTVGEFERNIPFPAKRYFMVFGVPNAEIRGEHAHRTCHQFLICVHGSCRVVADDGQHRQEFMLDAPSVGLHLPPLTWGIQYKYSTDAVLLVFASEYYDSGEYIRDYDEFTELTAHRRA